MQEGIYVREIHDFALWEKFVHCSGKWSLFQSFFWGEVQKSLGTRIYRLGIYDNEQLTGIAQIFLVRAKRGWFFHIRQGPVFKETDDNSLVKYWMALISHIKLLNTPSHYWFIRVSPMVENNSLNRDLFKKLGFLPAPIHSMDAELCWVLDITMKEEQILSNMRKTTRYLIKKAEKIGVKITESDDIRDFMSLYEITAKQHGFVKHRGIPEEFKIFSRNGQAKLLVAKYQDNILASALILFFENQAIYHHGASVTTNIPASYLLQWQAIRLAKTRNCRYYNFWGIAPENKPRHPWRGITLFKRGFGGEIRQFIHAHDLPLSPFYAISYTIETIRRINKRY